MFQRSISYRRHIRHLNDVNIGGGKYFMPIYEYKCEKCGKKFEVFQDIKDGEIKNCRFCNGPVNKLISLSSFHLKGSGWYVTDYGGKTPPPKSDTCSEAPACKKCEAAKCDEKKAPSVKSSDNL
jgi:putative FmdB family regulatory protein